MPEKAFEGFATSAYGHKSGAIPGNAHRGNFDPVLLSLRAQVGDSFGESALPIGRVGTTKRDKFCGVGLAGESLQMAVMVHKRGFE
jgi:hypothetical protein